jgi:hypothetical protein
MDVAVYLVRDGSGTRDGSLRKEIIVPTELAPNKFMGRDTFSSIARPVILNR